MGIWLSILLITLCAIMWDIGVVLQKKAADRLPALVLGKGTGRVLLAFVRHKAWMGGLVISALGWGLFAYALDFTPVSLARSIQGSGFVILAFLSVFFLDHRLRSIEWLGVAVVTAGIVALGLSEPAMAPTTTVLSPLVLSLSVAGIFVFCLLVVWLRKVGTLGFSWVVVFGLVAGCLLGIGDVLTKGMLMAADAEALGLAFGLIAPALVFFYLTGFFLLSRGYQFGRAILVTAVSDFCSRLVTIFLGVFVMGESFPVDGIHFALRLLGLAAILGGTVLLARFTGDQLADSKQ